MPKITTFLYCEGSQNEVLPKGGNKLHLIGPMLKLTPMFIPSMFSFSVCISIEDVSIDTQHVGKFVFNNPEGEEVINTGDVPMAIQPEAIDPTDEIHSLLLGLDFRNVVLKTEGVYVGKIYFDGELLGEQSIKAKEAIVK